jgi:2-oxoglutarate ferredoxin oxidoreductase subunit beta
VTKTSPRGIFENAVNPIVQALAGGASFVARGYVGEPEQLTAILKEAFKFPGFALIHILQPCVAWNRVNTYDFYRERVYRLEEVDHDPTDLMGAYVKAMEWWERIPIGIFYKKQRSVYRMNFPILKGEPMTRRSLEDIDISRLLDDFR